jgi:hypothetical protein
LAVSLQVVISAHGQLDRAWLDALRSAAAAAVLVKPGSRSSRARQQAAAAVRSNTSSDLQPATQLQNQPVGPATAAAVCEEGAAPDNAASASQEAVKGSDPAAAAAAAAAAAGATAVEGKPCRVPGTGLQAVGCSSCGWVFDQQDMFDQVLLLQLLQLLQPCVMRVKGVLRVAQKLWVMPQSVAAPQQQQQQQQGIQGEAEQGEQQQQQAANRSAACKALQLQPVCYRGPSMVEVIVSTTSVTSSVTNTAAAGAAGSSTGELHAVLCRFLQKRDQQQQQHCNAADSSSSSSCSGAGDPAVLAEEGVRKLVLNEGGSLQQLESTWQLLEEALLACLPHK